ncbi:MAG: hypothetical protein U0Y82_01750 [Thermoleophilia bacterium]
MTVLAFTQTAVAHVSVLPSTITKGVATEFTVQVPTERGIPTTAVRVMFPSQVTVYSFLAPPTGFTMRPLIAPNGSIVGVVYRGRIPLHQYANFHFLGTAFTKGRSIWRAFQTYADGKVKPWSGPPEAPGAVSRESGPTQPGPAAAVDIQVAGSSGATQAQNTGAAATGTVGRRQASGSGAAVWVALIAAVLAAVALVGTGLLWATRPVEMAEDRPPRRR